MKKYMIPLVVILIVLAGCKEDEEQGQVCSCSGTYTEYDDSDTTLAITIAIPNVFTPNGDGINDVFYVYGRGIQQISIVIKDGNDTVFSANSQNSGWDGTFNGNAPPACQTFDYIVDVTFANGVSQHFENTVTVFHSDSTYTCPSNSSKCIFGNQFDGGGFNTNFQSGEDLSGC